MSHVKKSFSTTRVIAFGFLGGILLGTLLLSLPIATKSGEVTPFTDALFTATLSLIHISEPTRRIGVCLDKLSFCY